MIENCARRCLVAQRGRRVKLDLLGRTLLPSINRIAGEVDPQRSHKPRHVGVVYYYSKEISAVDLLAHIKYSRLPSRTRTDLLSTLLPLESGR